MKYLLIFVSFLIPLTAFAETEYYDCEYYSFSDSSGNKKPSVRETHSFSVNAQSGKAFLINGGGSYEFVLVHYRDHIAMVQITPIGNVNSATIDKHMNIVYSRNTILIDTLKASQYYGTCKKR